MSRPRKSPRGILLAIVLLCTGVFASCGPPNRHARRNIAPSEITGSWKLTASSLAHLTHDGYTHPPERAHRIEFFPDGKMSFASVLQFASPMYTQSDGDWELRPDEWQLSTIEINNTVQIDLDIRVVTSLYIEDNGGTLVLWTYYQDPDLWEFLEYVREE